MVTTMAEIVNKNCELTNTTTNLIFVWINVIVDIFIKVVIFADFLFCITKTIKVNITCKSNQNDHTCCYEKWQCFVIYWIYMYHSTYPSGQSAGPWSKRWSVRTVIWEGSGENICNRSDKTSHWLTRKESRNLIEFRCFDWNRDVQRWTE